MAKKLKQKTHKGLAKRIRVSATGKLKRSSAGSSHLMSHMNGNQVRKLRSGKLVSSAHRKKLLPLLKGTRG